MKITVIIVWPNEIVTVTIIELEFLHAKFKSEIQNTL